MKNWKKIALIVAGVVILLAIVGFTVQQSRKGVVAVQTGKVVREDLASVWRNQAQGLRKHWGQCVWKDHPLVRQRGRPRQAGPDARDP